MRISGKNSDKTSSQIQGQYSEKSFWQKLTKYASKAGKDVVETALALFYALQDKDTPSWAKTVIIGALAYFILPSDVIPDFLPGGYVDDLATLLAALKLLTNSIKPEHEEQARLKSLRWFSATSRKD